MAREKALHAVLISLVRQFIPEMKDEDCAGKIKIKKGEIYKLVDKILERIEIVDKEEVDSAKKDLDKIIEYWDKITDGNNLTYSKKNTKKLLVRTDETNNSTEGFITLNSMRNVDTSSNIYVIE